MKVTSIGDKIPLFKPIKYLILIPLYLLGFWYCTDCNKFHHLSKEEIYVTPMDNTLTEGHCEKRYIDELARDKEIWDIQTKLWEEQ